MHDCFPAVPDGIPGNRGSTARMDGHGHDCTGHRPSDSQPALVRGDVQGQVQRLSHRLYLRERAVAPVMGDTYLKQHEAPEDVEYYLCGPPMMAKTVLDLLHSLGVSDEDIRFDNFG